MEQQIAPTLWLPPGTCLLNSIPTMQIQQTSHHQLTSDILKTHQVITPTVPAGNLIHNQQYLQQTQHMPAQNVVHFSNFDNLLLPPSGNQIYEIPYLRQNLQVDQRLQIPVATTVLQPDIISFPGVSMNSSKIIKKKKISPSAKRRSRLRLIAFLESKKKQQNELNSLEENSALHEATISTPSPSTSSSNSSPSSCSSTSPKDSTP